MFEFLRCRRHLLIMLLALGTVFVFIANFLVSSGTILNFTTYLRDVHFNTRMVADKSEGCNDVYAQRSTRAMDSCFKHNLGRVQRIISDKDGRLANCIVPKVGCTYWINIFRFLNNETHGTVYDSPFDIPRFVTHYANKAAEAKMRKNSTGPDFLSDRLRFMFVREPYSRLWSAWIDKFWLPDYWIWSYTFKIGQRENSSDPCFYTNASFVDFLKFVTRKASFKDPGSLNEHWAPYKQLCDPCMFRPHVIGKIETFNQDSRYILDSVNLTWVLDPPKKVSPTDQPKDHSLKEMKLLADYNEHIFYHNSLNSKGLKNCSSIYDIYQRVWKAFQYNGHLPASAEFPFDSSNDTYTRKDFLQVAEETYMSWKGRSKAVQNQQKKEAMLNAYKEVPTEVMEKLQTLYAIDFEMYDYDIRPHDLYWYR